MSRRRPVIAALLSVPVPGLGHLYAGQPVAAAVAWLTSMLSIALFTATLFLLGSSPSKPVFVLAVLAFATLLLVLVAIPAHAARTASRQPDSFEPRRYNRWYVYLAAYLLLGYLLSPKILDLLRSREQAYQVPSGSMEPTLLIGDWLVVEKARHPPSAMEVGSLVVFESVEEPGLQVVKRVLGVPGDTLAMASGTLRRNGRDLPEPYAVHQAPARSEDAEQRTKMRAWQLGHTVAVDASSYAPDVQTWGPIVVPPDSFFALGDNRDHSYDSRYYGFVPFSGIVGRPRIVYFSVEWDTTGAAIGVRWPRIGRALR